MPPTGQHADQAEPRAHLPDATAALAELLVGDGLEAVLARREQHALEAHAVVLLLAPTGLELKPGVAQPGDEIITQGLELADAEEPGALPTWGARRGDRLGRATAEGRDQNVAEVALEAGDLRAEPTTGRAGIGADDRRGGRGNAARGGGHGALQDGHRPGM